MDLTERDLLIRTAAGLGVELTEIHLEKLFTYLSELCAWNRRFNLTGLKSRKRMIVELLADSMVSAPLIPFSACMLDVGSGAGLPGIPLKIVRPDLIVHLLEPSQKRFHFLRHIIRILDMEGIQAVRGRVEDSLEGLHSDGYGVVTSRAVSELPAMIAMCSARVAHGGILLGFTGRGVEACLADAERSLGEVGFYLEKSVRYSLSAAAGVRHALVLRKEGSAGQDE